MKDWVLTIGIDKFYLTEKERNFYLESINKGAKFVSLPDGRVFGSSFQTLVHKNVLEGKWNCDKGNWHSKGAECFCEAVFNQLPDGTVRIE